MYLKGFFCIFYELITFYDHLMTLIYQEDNTILTKNKNLKCLSLHENINESFYHEFDTTTTWNFLYLREYW